MSRATRGVPCGGWFVTLIAMCHCAPQHARITLLPSNLMLVTHRSQPRAACAALARVRTLPARWNVGLGYVALPRAWWLDRPRPLISAYRRARARPPSRQGNELLERGLPDGHDTPARSARCGVVSSSRRLGGRTGWHPEPTVAGAAHIAQSVSRKASTTCTSHEASCAHAHARVSCASDSQSARSTSLLHVGLPHARCSGRPLPRAIRRCMACTLPVCCVDWRGLCLRNYAFSCMNVQRALTTT